MSARNDVPPSTLGVEVGDDGVTVEYLDGRQARYLCALTETGGPVRCQPGKEVHVLVTDAGASQGVMLYVNDLNTHDDILESTGVGRVMLDPGEQASPFPGVTVRTDGHAIVVDAEPVAVDGRVFVFEEDDRGERAYELVSAPESR